MRQPEENRLVSPDNEAVPSALGSVITASSGLTLVIILVCTGCVGIANGLTMPLLNVILYQRGVSLTLIGVSSMMMPIGGVVAPLLLPRLARHLAAAPLLAVLLASWASICIGFMALPLLAVWFILRGIQGFIASSTMIAAETWLNTLMAKQQITTGFPLYVVVLNAAIASGVAMAALWHSASWQPFIIAAALLTLMATVLWLMRSQLANQPCIPRYVMSWAGLDAVVLSGGLLSGMVASAALGFLPIHALRSGYGETSALLSIVVMTLGLLTVPLMQRSWLGLSSGRVAFAADGALLWVAALLLAFTESSVLALAGGAYLLGGCLSIL
jgi:MFS family permease